MKIFKILILMLSISLVSCDKDCDCKGEPKKDVACFQLYDPVCGCDGVTYGNECEATVSGIKEYTPGECGKTINLAD